MSFGLNIGIQTFKRFLSECRDLQATLHISEETKLCILQEYLDAQISKDEETTCDDIFQAWSFASQVRFMLTCLVFLEIKSDANGRNEI